VNPGYKLASISRYDDIVRTAGWAGSGCAAGRWLAVDRGGVLNITAAAWTAGFYWWHSGNITQTQTVSEYMFVLALCLVLVILAQYQRVMDKQRGGIALSYFALLHSCVVLTCSSSSRGSRS